MGKMHRERRHVEVVGTAYLEGYQSQRQRQERQILSQGECHRSFGVM